MLVNTTPAGNQCAPSITALADGRFVVTWSDLSASGGDTSGFAVRAQVFTANGAKSGAEFVVNTTTAGNQGGPAITALEDGRFVVSWTDQSPSGGDTSGYAVRGQVFTADGAEFGAEFLVNTTTANIQFEPGDHHAGEWPLCGVLDGWQRERRRRLWPGGARAGLQRRWHQVRHELRVNTTKTGDQLWSAITALTGWALCGVLAG